MRKSLPIVITLAAQEQNRAAVRAEALNTIADVLQQWIDSGNVYQQMPHHMLSNWIAVLRGQEPLGADFEKVWDENTDKLYEP